VIYGSLCSGIEAASVALAPLGWRCAFMAEIEPSHPTPTPEGSMSDRHTPGPWFIAPRTTPEIEICATNPADDEPWFIAAVYENGGPHPDSGEANARLIASAPAMLSILRAFLGHDDRFYVSIGGNPIAVEQFLSAARNVVAQATGSQP